MILYENTFAEGRENEPIFGTTDPRSALCIGGAAQARWTDSEQVMGKLMFKSMGDWALANFPNSFM